MYYGPDFGSNLIRELGRLVRRTVENGVDSQDLRRMEQKLNRTVKRVLRDDPPPAGGYREPNHTQSTPGGYGPTPPPPHREPEGRRCACFDGLPSVSASGILMTVFGAIGLGIFALCAIGALIGLLVVEGRVAALSMAVFLGVSVVLSLVGGLLLRAGIVRSGRVRRCNAYAREIRSCDLCPISALAAAVRKPEDYVVRDLERMIAAGQMPHCHLDAGKTTLILGDETYQQYLRAEELAQKKREEEAQTAANAQLAAALKEGQGFLERIRQANDRIPGEEISRKIDRLEQITQQIFEAVKKDPDQLPEIRRFMDYYLPTTLKLLEAYCRFDAQPVQGENLTQAKAEIGSALDTINLAFQNLLDSLFQEEALDISTDISALQAMLAQEGLTQSGFGSSSSPKGPKA